jgi:hypothetical protein
LAPDLDPDSIADDLAPGGEEPDVVAMVGFLGESARQDHVRFFLDPELALWFDIPVEHVKRRQRLPLDGHAAAERTVLWIAGEWMRRRLFDEEQINSMAESFMIGSFALTQALPDTVAAAVEEVDVRISARCPTTMCTPHCR